MIRPDIAKAMKGQQMTKAIVAVATRLVMPTPAVIELGKLLNRVIQDQPIAPGSNRSNRTQ